MTMKILALLPWEMSQGLNGADIQVEEDHV